MHFVFCSHIGAEVVVDVERERENEMWHVKKELLFTDLLDLLENVRDQIEVYRVYI